MEDMQWKTELYSKEGELLGSETVCDYKKLEHEGMPIQKITDQLEDVQQVYEIIWSFMINRRKFTEWEIEHVYRLNWETSKVHSVPFYIIGYRENKKLVALGSSFREQDKKTMEDYLEAFKEFYADHDSLKQLRAVALTVVPNDETWPKDFLKNSRKVISEKSLGKYPRIFPLVKT